MKTLKFLTVCVLCAALFASCSNGTSKKLPGISQGQIDSVSYAVGVSFGGMMKQSNMEDLNFAQIQKGINDMLEGKELKINEDQISVVINDYMMKAQVAMQQLREQEQTKFFEENGKKDGVNSTESGLQYRIEVPGNNEIMATAQDTVEVHYTGMLLDGTVFDSSVERGETAKFPLKAVIKGWTEGMQLVGEGGKIKLWIPFEMGYGPRAMGPNLPAYSTLVFDVELIKVYKATPKDEK